MALGPETSDAPRRERRRAGRPARRRPVPASAPRTGTVTDGTNAPPFAGAGGPQASMCSGPEDEVIEVAYRRAAQLAAEHLRVALALNPSTFSEAEIVGQAEKISRAAISAFKGSLGTWDHVLGAGQLSVARPRKNGSAASRKRVIRFPDREETRPGQGQSEGRLVSFTQPTRTADGRKGKRKAKTLVGRDLAGVAACKGFEGDTA